MVIDPTSAVVLVGMLVFILTMLFGAIGRAKTLWLLPTAIIAGIIAGIIMASALTLFPSGVFHH